MQVSSVFVFPPRFAVFEASGKRKTGGLRDFFGVFVFFPKTKDVQISPEIWGTEEENLHSRSKSLAGFYVHFLGDVDDEI